MSRTIGDHLEALECWLGNIAGGHDELYTGETPVSIVYLAAKEIVNQRGIAESASTDSASLRARVAELEAERISTPEVIILSYDAWAESKANKGGFQIKWEGEGRLGFGVTSLLIEKNRSITINSKVMSPEFIKALMCQVVDSAKLRDANPAAEAEKERKG